MCSLKLPKTLPIAGRTYKVVRALIEDAGQFDMANKVLTINEALDDEDVLQTLFHEVIEGVLTERALRYSDIYDGDGYIFVFDHEQLNRACMDIYAALQSVIKKPRVKRDAKAKIASKVVTK